MPGLQGDESRYPFAYTYRDWVVRSLNEDMPYDKFLLYQIAADQMDLGDDRRPLAALGFLTLGPRTLNGEPDVMDDRIDVVMRGTQALTVGCARCHDHKFDPVPTKDYYSLYGVFAASTEQTVPLLTGPEARAGMAAFEREKQAREAKVTQYLQQKKGELLAHTRSHYADYLQAAVDPVDTVAGGDETVSGLKIAIIARWRDAAKAAKRGPSPVLGPWVAFAALPYSQFAAKAQPLAARYARYADPANRTNPLIAKCSPGRLRLPCPISPSATPVRSRPSICTGSKRSKPRRPAEPPRPPHCRTRPRRRYAGSFRAARSLGDTGRSGGRFPEGEGAGAPAGASPRHQPVDGLAGSAAARAGAGRRSHDGEPARLSARQPGDAGRGRSAPLPALPRRRQARTVPARQRPARAGPGHRQPVEPAHGARDGQPRLAGPLRPGDRTHAERFRDARRAADHPELLDWLANYFMDNGWSLKKLHRLILLSAAYQQSDEDSAASRKIDPDNRLVWRMNRRRLDFEQMRDSLLAAAAAWTRRWAGAAWRSRARRSRAAERSTRWWTGPTCRRCTACSTSPTRRAHCRAVRDHVAAAVALPARTARSSWSRRSGSRPGRS